MAFKRADIAGLGIEADKIPILIDWHMETVKGLQAEIDRVKGDADELARVRAELEQAKKDLQTANATIEAAQKEDYKGKYESEKAAHEKLQSDIVAKETAAKKEAALTAAAKKAKYSADAISLILDSKKDYAGRIEFDEEGNPKNVDDILAEIATDRPGLIPKAKETHHEPNNPPKNDAGGKAKLTKAEIMEIKDDAERQQAIKDNLEAFGIQGDSE